MSEPERPRSYFGWPVAFALVAIIAILTGAVFLRSTNPVREAAQVAEAWAGLFKPAVQVQTVIHSSFARLTNEAKLVVMTATMDIEVIKTSEKKYFNNRLDLGTTVVRLRALDNKAQYFVPLNKLGPDSFEFDPAGKRVVVHVPRPRVDNGLVEVQSDPSRIDVEMKTGWARLSAFSGAMLLDEAHSDLRLALLENAHSDYYLLKAKESAQTRLQNLLEPLAQSLNPGVKLEIVFENKY